MRNKKYLKTLLNGSGHLNKNKFKGKDSQPDLIGFVKIDSNIYKLSAWNKKNTISINAELFNLSDID